MAIVCLLLVLLFNHGVNGIIDGIPATAAHEFPYTALVRIAPRRICSGTIIGEWHILTCAHCVINAASEKVGVLVGYPDIRSVGASFRNVTEVIIHPDYTYYLDERTNYLFADKDLAVVKLASQLTWGRNIAAVALPDDMSICTCCLCYVAGWGLRSPLLTWASVLPAERSLCSETEYLTGQQSCASDPMMLASIGQGDTGAGLVCNDRLSGIITHQGHESSNMIFLAIYPHKQFITDAMGA